MNVGLLIIGFILIGPEFGAKTIYCSILMPLVMGVFEWIVPNFQSITQDPLLDVICYILVVGVGLAILFSRNASSGGLDIVAKILNKYLRIDLGKAMTYSGVAVALVKYPQTTVNTGFFQLFLKYLSPTWTMHTYLKQKEVNRS